MSSANGMFAASAATNAVSSVGQAYSQAKAIKAQGKYQEQIALGNSRLSEFFAADSLKRGDTEAEFVKKRGNQIVGAQRASFAAQGIEVDSGTAMAVQEETTKMAELDALTVKNNAWREAWGFKVEASNASFSGRFAALGARNEGRSTLLTGGINAARYGAEGIAHYQRYKEGKY